MSISVVSIPCLLGYRFVQWSTSEEPTVSSWRPPLCKRAIGSEKCFSICLVFSVELCKMVSKTKGQFVSDSFITTVKLVIFARVIFRAQPPYRHIRGLLFAHSKYLTCTVQQYAHDVVDMYLPLHNGFINGCTYTLGTSSWSLRGRG